MFSMEAMVEKISEHSKIEPDKVRSMIAEKQEELSGLVSEEGAAYIVARELGLNMIKETRKQLKVRSLVSGLRSVDLAARIIRVYDERTFERDGKQGSVMNLLVGDETGVIRLSLWNQETALVKEGKIKEGDTIKVSGGWVKTDNRDNLELRIGRGTIAKADQVIDLPDRQQMEQSFSTARRTEISGFKEGGSHEVRAAFVQVFRRNPFFSVCPECKSRVKDTDGKWICDDHGDVKPDYALVLSGILDDGSANVRAVFFREIAEQMFGKPTLQLKADADKADDSLAVFENVDALGKEFVFTGRVKLNSYTESLEFMVNSVEDVDVKKEAESILKELSS